MSSLQIKLTAALSALILFVSIVSGILIERGLRVRETLRLEESLKAQLTLVQELAEAADIQADADAEIDALADRAATATGSRVTLIAGDGTVRGDSEVDLARIPALKNHRDRPEVQAALTDGHGRSVRHSKTVGRELLYVAAPLRSGAGVARVAMDLASVDAAVNDLRLELVTATIVGLVAAIALSFVLAWVTLRPLGEMKRVAGSIAKGDLEARLPLRMSDELGEISDAINQMADQLGQRLGETTAEKERLDAILNSMVEGVLVVDAAGALLLVNNRLRDLFDVPSDVRGRSPLEAVRNADVEQLLADAAGTDDPVSCEIQIGGLDTRDLRVHAVRFPSGDVPRMGTVAVFHDLTEIRRLEQVRQDFVANASHELRTPLAAVQGFTETLLHSSDLSPDNQRSYLAIIERHALRLGHIVDDLLVLSRAESGDTSLYFGDVDLGSLAASLVEDARNRPRAARLQIELVGPDSAYAWADRGAAEQVLSNLLDNAIKYTEPGGRIEVGIEEEGDRIRAYVSDTGIGIPEEDLSRIFERFYRVDKARSREMGGTGLGLAIVKHLVQQMGGEIAVKSEFGEGSTFSFSLPRERPEHRRASEA